MNFDEHTYDQIQRYLDKDLNADELRAFEAELQSNPALSAELALHREMEVFLSDSDENALRKNLEILGEKSGQKEGSGGSWWKYGLLLIPILLVGIWWITESKESQAVVKVAVEENMDSNISNTAATVQKDSIKQTVLIEKDSLIEEVEKTEEILPKKGKSKTVPPIKKTTPPQQNKQKDTLIYANDDSKSVPYLETPEFIPPRMADNVENSPQPPVLAANFEPNPAIDLLIENNTRSDDFVLTANVFTAQFDLKPADEPIKFRLRGTVKSDDNLLEKAYQLHLFSNEKTAFQNFMPLQTNEFTLTKSGEEYAFDFQKEYSLEAGLYYVIVEEVATEQMVFVEKLVID